MSTYRFALFAGSRFIFIIDNGDSMEMPEPFDPEKEQTDMILNALNSRGYYSNVEFDSYEDADGALVLTGTVED